jgi:hypothetical protein
VLFCCTGGCGCAKRPAFPAPSDIERANFLYNSGASRREKAELYLVVIASEAKQSISPSKERMDCFVAFAPLRKRFAFVAGNDV